MEFDAWSLAREGWFPYAPYRTLAHGPRADIERDVFNLDFAECVTSNDWVDFTHRARFGCADLSDPWTIGGVGVCRCFDFFGSVEGVALEVGELDREAERVVFAGFVRHQRAAEV